MSEKSGLTYSPFSTDGPCLCAADNISAYCTYPWSIFEGKSIEDNIWLVVWGIFYFSIQLGSSAPQVTFIFFRGVGSTTNQTM